MAGWTLPQTILQSGIIDGNNGVEMRLNKTVVVAGPTASGKTALAVQIAELTRGEIISADSRQIYRGMDLGTGKDLEEYGAIPYHCIDIADAHEIYTLYHFQKDCYNALEHCFSRNVVPIISGGTGLYIEAVLNAYKIPNVPENETFRIEQTVREKDDLERELKERAPDIHSETDCSSKKRIVRALEVAIARESAPISYSSDNAVDLSPTILITEWDPEKLRKRIEKRMIDRFDAGMIQEVADLKSKGVSDDRLNLFGLEYREINRFLNGECSQSELYESLKLGIFHLAKRQRTWFRGMERRGFTVYPLPESSLDCAVEILRNEGFIL